MPRFKSGYDDFDEPPPGFDDHEPTPLEPSSWPPPVSGKALASLVLGVMFCIPLVPSLLATLFGILGLHDTRLRVRSGRGFAIGGLILGILGVAGWLLVGSTAYLLLNVMGTESARANAVSEAFLRELADGKIDAALARAPAGTPRQPLEAASRAMQDWGRLDSVSGDLLPVLAKHPVPRWEIEGTASFARADRDFTVRLVQEGTTYRVDRFQLAARWVVGGNRWGDPK